MRKQPNGHCTAASSGIDICILKRMHMGAVWPHKTETDYHHVMLSQYVTAFRKRLDQSKSPRVRLQRLEKCLDQKVTVVRQLGTGSTA